MGDGDALLDVNVLVALVWPQHVHHRRTVDWLGPRSGHWCTTPLTESALVRLSLNRSVSGTEVTAEDVLDVLGALRGHPLHRFLPDDSSLSDPRIRLTRLATGRQVADLHLVNLAATVGVTLVTLDRGIPEMLEPADRGHVALIPAD